MIAIVLIISHNFNFLISDRVVLATSRGLYNLIFMNSAFYLTRCPFFLSVLDK